MIVDEIPADLDLLGERDQAKPMKHIEKAPRQFVPGFIASPFSLSQIIAHV
ncbi:hypothetical protein D3C83_171630 [compost metagenome]